MLFEFVKVHLNEIMELASLLVAVAYYKYIRRSFMKWVLPFLIIMFIGERICFFTSETDQVNIAACYFLGIVEMVFYGYIFSRFANRKIFTRITHFLVWTSVMAFVTAYILHHRDYQYFFPVSIVSGFFLAAIALGYLYTSILDEQEISLPAEPGFWMALGVCLFFSSVSIVLCLYDRIVKNDLSISGIKLHQFIPRILCIVLYSCISIAVIVCKNKKQPVTDVTKTVAEL